MPFQNDAAGIDECSETIQIKRADGLSWLTLRHQVGHELRRHRRNRQTDVLVSDRIEDARAGRAPDTGQVIGCLLYTSRCV